MRIDAIPALKDNYIWAISTETSKKILIVDPGQAKPVIKYLSHNDAELAYILVTHHHLDHTNGITELVDKYNPQVIRPDDLADGQKLEFPELDLKLTTLKIPGHTLDHSAYYNDEIIFTGDTLFAAGCGRVFEGTNNQMFGSLQKLKSLNPTTRIYCGHEYTLKNLEFAITIYPDNRMIKNKLDLVQELQAEGKCTLPSTIQEELETNVFLMAKNVGEFTKLRTAKDNF